MAADRKPYRVNIGGIEHTMLLTERGAAEMYGDRATPVRQKAAEKPANKARAPQNKK